MLLLPLSLLLFLLLLLPLLLFLPLPLLLFLPLLLLLLLLLLLPLLLFLPLLLPLLLPLPLLLFLLFLLSFPKGICFCFCLCFPVALSRFHPATNGSDHGANARLPHAVAACNALGAPGLVFRCAQRFQHALRTLRLACFAHRAPVVNQLM